MRSGSGEEAGTGCCTGRCAEGRRPRPRRRTEARRAESDAGRRCPVRLQQGRSAPEGKAKLDKLSGDIKGIKLEVIIAVGHADRFGTDAYNQKLSEKRAEAVKAYLVSKGVEPNRVYTEGKGEKQPITRPISARAARARRSSTACSLIVASKSKSSVRNSNFA